MMPRTVDIGDLPTDPLALKAMLEEGIAELNSVRDNLHALNEHQATIQNVKDQLDEQLNAAEEKSSEDTGLTNRRGGGLGPTSSRMVYNKRRR